jgi:bifunctional N-acetylglucosamine-1-phosphate-uridyltransferase/glucosamine-1-phosphate-acetyltransferase GlmU-like protein
MNKVVILAAGKGTRMGSDLPKALFPLKGRAMIEYLLESVFASGVDPEPILVVSPEREEMMKQNLNKYNLRYVIQKEQLGTGHAASCARTAISEGVKNVIVLYCDHPFISAASIKKISSEEENILSLMPTEVGDFNEWRKNFYHWGRIVRDTENKVKRISEFKDSTEEEKNITEVNPGIMSFNSAWLWENIDKLKNNNSQQEYYLTDLVGLASAQGQKIGGLIIDPLEAMGINSQEELKIAEGLI